jgi:putative Mg2+ transporter-C (MgtC) family protein
VIPREHRARLVVTCAPSWRVLEDLPQLLDGMKLRTRFQEEKLSADAQNADYVFELAWRRPERVTPPADLFPTVESRFQIKSFELTTDNAR